MFIEHFWQPLLKVVKLPYRQPHAIRHSYATWLLEDGADLRFIKDQMGHSSIEETEGTYGHLQLERHAPRVDRLESYLCGAGGKSLLAGASGSTASQPSLGHQEESESRR